MVEVVFKLKMVVSVFLHDLKIMGMFLHRYVSAKKYSIIDLTRYIKACRLIPGQNFLEGNLYGRPGFYTLISLHTLSPQ